MLPTPFFHESSGSVRFWVKVGDLPEGATIGRQTLHYRFCPGSTTDDPLQTYLAHSEEINAAVCRRVATGSIEPVMLRDLDVQALPAG